MVYQREIHPKGALTDNSRSNYVTSNWTSRRIVIIFRIYILLLVLLTIVIQVETYREVYSKYWASMSFHPVELHRKLQDSTPTLDRNDDLESIYDDNYYHHKMVKAQVDEILLVQYGDFIYTRNDWDGAPVIIEEFRLIFFTTAKVGCTVWKQLFRRMMGYQDWMTEEITGNHLLPWNPDVNGLKYLYDYNREEASYIMSSPKWTRAIFVRDPKERLVSAYLDKVISHEYYFQQKCCPNSGRCVHLARSSIEGFLPYLYTCDDAHWRPQYKRMEEKYWPYINFVGYMENIHDDAKRLLQHIGAWNQYGKSGWGIGQNESIFEPNVGGSGRHHATDAKHRLREYLTPEMEVILDEYYAADYNHKIMNFTKVGLYVQ